MIDNVEIFNFTNVIDIAKLNNYNLKKVKNLRFRDLIARSEWYYYVLTFMHITKSSHLSLSITNTQTQTHKHTHTHTHARTHAHTQTNTPLTYPLTERNFTNGVFDPLPSTTLRNTF